MHTQAWRELGFTASSLSRRRSSPSEACAWSPAHGAAAQSEHREQSQFAAGLPPWRSPLQSGPATIHTQCSSTTSAAGDTSGGATSVAMPITCGQITKTTFCGCAIIDASTHSTHSLQAGRVLKALGLQRTRPATALHTCAAASSSCSSPRWSCLRLRLRRADSRLEIVLQAW